MVLVTGSVQVFRLRAFNVDGADVADVTCCK